MALFRSSLRCFFLFFLGMADLPSRTLSGIGLRLIILSRMAHYIMAGRLPQEPGAGGWRLPSRSLLQCYCCCPAAGEAGEVRKESLQKAVLAALRKLDKVGPVGSTTSIARHLHRDKASISHELAELIQAGKVVKGER
jgi:hypothetical protein